MAVINIGSGSVKLYLSSTGKTESRVTLLASTNNSQAAQETFSAVACFYSAALAAGEPVVIFGTEAMRKSGGVGGVLRTRIESELGVPVDIIDGQTEALCGFLGAADGQPMTVIDVGGASTELSAGKASPEFVCSLPIGSVALHGIFGKKETPDCAFLPELFAFIDGVLKTTSFDFGGHKRVVLIGGSGNYSVRVFSQRRGLSHNTEAHMNKCADDELLTAEIPDIIKELFALTPALRSKLYPFLEEKRALVFPYGMCIVYRALCFLGAHSARSSKVGLIEGYIKHKGLQQSLV